MYMNRSIPDILALRQIEVLEYSVIESHFSKQMS